MKSVSSEYWNEECGIKKILGRKKMTQDCSDLERDRPKDSTSKFQSNNTKKSMPRHIINQTFEKKKNLKAVRNSASITYGDPSLNDQEFLLKATEAEGK